MPKRSAEEKIKYYNAKIQKLQTKKSKKRRHSAIVYSSSDSEGNLDVGPQPIEDHYDAMLSEPIPEPPEPCLGAQQQETSDEALPHQDGSIELKGIQKESKEILLKEYNVPNNCKLLKAPTLNAEIAAAISDIIRTRDKKIEIKQDQLGLGITAINRAISLLLTGEDKIHAVKILSDGCRILSDLHFVETQVRKKLITPGLDKSFLSVIQDQDRDETLFGNTLPEKIKASKAIEKQGKLIKKVNTIRQSAASAPSTSRTRYQGNWMGPPRFAPSNRGRATASYRTPYHRPPTSTIQSSFPRPLTSTTSNKHVGPQPIEDHYDAMLSEPIPEPPEPCLGAQQQETSDEALPHQDGSIELVP
ncbi:hypothetical protein ACJJTC_004648 [Scirpophaga incertulas]